MTAKKRAASPLTRWQFNSDSEDDTSLLGEVLGRALVPGTTMALVGDLGAGKTRLVQAIAEGLGVDRRAVTSPSFTLIQEYLGRLPIYHFDAYRLHDSDDFLNLGADELLESDGVCLIEWADHVTAALPDDALRVEIEITRPTSRVFRFSGSGPKSNAVIGRLNERNVNP